MELKILILGIFMSTAAFAIKAGGGLAYLLWSEKKKRRNIFTAFNFAGIYGFVFLTAALILTKIDLMRHIDLLQNFFKSGMTIHLILAIFLIVWGVRLLSENRCGVEHTKGWVPLMVPCPVCFSVILLSCAFIRTLYPENLWIFFFFYAGFVLISFIFAFFFSQAIKNEEAATPFLGNLMLYIAGYFLLSVLVIPQFADLERIYSISCTQTAQAVSKEKLIVVYICLSVFISGGAASFIKSLTRG